jgi:hypothetical protein
MVTRVRSINILQLAIVYAALYAILGLVLGLIFGFVSMGSTRVGSGLGSFGWMSIVISRFCTA